MIVYLIRRLVQIPITLFGVTVFIFAMLQLLSPVERSALYINSTPYNDSSIDAIIRKYGLDDPFYIQYMHWMVGIKDQSTGEMAGGVLRGDLGYSRTGRLPVKELIANRLPATVELALWSILPIIGGGILLGVIAAIYHNKFIDQIIRVFVTIGWSFPTFVFGLLLLLILYAKLQWFPPGRLSDPMTAVVSSAGFRQYTHMYTIDAILNLRLDVFWDALRHLIMPIITLSYVIWAQILRVTRSSMLETLRQDYITTARSKGLSERMTIFRHAFRNALIPVVTLGGLMVVNLLNGVVVTEIIFDYPGMGSAAARAAGSLDALAVLGFVLFGGFVLILANVFVDLLYAVIDPRIRLVSQGGS
ncbi:MAG: ABC transporter permease [Anaerolineaceae bacterium]|nr:ABC transporter permease [Anaerolineaceae bacterium]